MRKMEISDAIYENARVTKDNRMNRTECKDSKNSCEGVYANHDNVEIQRPRNSKQSESPGGHTTWNRCYRPTAVCVVLMCVFLLAAVTVLCIKYNNLNTENSQLQTSNNNLTIERDQLQTSNSKLTIERNKLQKERDEYLMAFCNSDKGVCFSFNSSLYFMSNEKKNWTESRQDCRQRGADLVIINSTEEQTFIIKLLRGQTSWTGLNDRVKEGEWKWVDDTPLSTGRWIKGEPNSEVGDEDCVVTGDASDPDRNWADYPCYYTLIWICEKKISN